MAENEQEGLAGGDFESMTPEQLEQHLDGTPQAAPVDEQAPAKQEPEGGQGAATQVNPDPISRLEKRIEEMHREMGRFRGMQSNFDKLPQTIEEKLKGILEQRQRQEYLNSLSPEERESSENYVRQEQMLRDRIRQESIAAMREAFPEQLQFLEQAQEERKDQQFLGEVTQLAEQMAPGSSQGVAQLFQKNYQDLQSSDPAVVREALQWNERATTNPEFVVLELMKAKGQQVQQGAVRFSNTKAAEVAKARQGVRGGQATSVGKRSLEGMTQADLEALSTEELDALIPK